MGFNSGFTAIRTIEGDKYIKDIVVGTSVMSYKESYHIAKKLVQELATKYDVSYNIRCDDDIVGYRFQGVQLVMSEDGWRYVKDLKKGDSLLTLKGIKKIVDIEKMETINKICYSLEVNRAHSYFADGILVCDEVI